ncbi:PorT family protein [bacterium]|nr:PorT family protein [bacterium]
MRKIIFCAVALILSATAIFSGPLSFTPFAGVNLASFSITLDTDNQEVKTSIAPCPALGMTVRVPLILTGLGVEVSALYLQKGTHVEVMWNEDGVPLKINQTIKGNYFEIPLHLTWSPLPTGRFPYLIAGASTGFKLTDLHLTVDKYTVDGTDILYLVPSSQKETDIKTTEQDITFDIGVGLRVDLFVRTFRFEVLYQWGASDIYDDFNKDSGKMCTRSLLLTAGMEL